MMVLLSREMLKIGLLNFTRQYLRRLEILSALGLILFILSAIPTLGLCTKRVGIVYSETSSNQFYDKFSYSQLFIAMQHQAMMAGIPFDVLSEGDLTASAKLIGYNVLIIPSMGYAENEAAVTHGLRTASENGVGIITAGVLLSDEATADILGVEYAGRGPTASPQR
jgi:hypothetical protein